MQGDLHLASVAMTPNGSASAKPTLPSQATTDADAVRLLCWLRTSSLFAKRRTSGSIDRTGSRRASAATPSIERTIAPGVVGMFQQMLPDHTSPFAQESTKLEIFSMTNAPDERPHTAPIEPTPQPLDDDDTLGLAGCGFGAIGE
jgi:hypothetical protein